MNLLLDTHALLWWLDDPTQLSEKARAAVAEGGNSVFVSAAAAWEVAIKQSLGKLDAPDDLLDMMVEERFQPLPISVPHALAVVSLPPIHQDPFDRIQIAQAKLENLTLVTRDPLIHQYDLNLLEA